MISFEPYGELQAYATVSWPTIDAVVRFQAFFVQNRATGGTFLAFPSTILHLKLIFVGNQQPK